MSYYEIIMQKWMEDNIEEAIRVYQLAKEGGLLTPEEDKRLSELLPTFSDKLDESLDKPDFIQFLFLKYKSKSGLSDEEICRQLNINEDTLTKIKEGKSRSKRVAVALLEKVAQH